MAAYSDAYGKSRAGSCKWAKKQTIERRATNAFDFWRSNGATVNIWNSVTYGNGLFVAVSSSGTGNRVMTSPLTSTFYTTSGESVIQRKGATFVHTSVRATGDTTQVSVNNSGNQMRVTTNSIAQQLEHSEIRYKISEM